MPLCNERRPFVSSSSKPPPCPVQGDEAAEKKLHLLRTPTETNHRRDSKAETARRGMEQLILILLRSIVLH